MYAVLRQRRQPLRGMPFASALKPQVFMCAVLRQRRQQLKAMPFADAFKPQVFKCAVLKHASDDAIRSECALTQLAH